MFVPYINFVFTPNYSLLHSPSNLPRNLRDHVLPHSEVDEITLALEQIHLDNSSDEEGSDPGYVTIASSDPGYMTIAMPEATRVSPTRGFMSRFKDRFGMNRRE